jgi:hypothetical protein
MSPAAAVEIQRPRGVQQADDWAYQRGGSDGGAAKAPAVGVARNGMAKVGAAGAEVTNSRSALALASTHPSILFCAPDTQSSAKNWCFDERWGRNKMNRRVEPENVLTSVQTAVQLD